MYELMLILAGAGAYHFIHQKAFHLGRYTAQKESEARDEGWNEAMQSATEQLEEYFRAEEEDDLPGESASGRTIN